ncbi:MAG: YgaP family membrane protein [Fibrobacterota bacterium]
MLKINEGKTDRIIRGILGAVLITLSLTILQGGIATASLIVGIISAITGITGFCGLYKVLGLSTCPRKNR